MRCGSRGTKATRFVIVTVDTNVLVSGVFFGGVPGKIVTAAREGVFTLAMTPLLLSELRNVLSRAKFMLDSDAVQLLIADMEACATIVYPGKRHQVVARDPDDDAVVDCAVESGSSYIVSGDSHLSDMDRVGGITVVTPRRFAEFRSGPPNTDLLK
jgi:uncharacterized protein